MRICFIVSYRILAAVLDVVSDDWYWTDDNQVSGQSTVYRNGTDLASNIGNDSQALWKHYDSSVTDSFVQRRQNIHVCIISFGSFSGRLMSGIGSDALVKKFDRSRFWCLFVSASTFCAAQLCALMISNPHLLVLVSG